MNKNQLTTLTGYSLIHGIIDLCCVGIIFHTLSYHNIDPKTSFIIIVTYNLIAFGLQAPLGALVDKFRIPQKSALIGCILVLLSFFLANIPILVTILSGLGNALFHIGGGSISLNFDPEKTIAPGIFVAPGALGLTLGTLIGKSDYFISWPFILLLVASSLFIIKSKIPKINYQEKSVKPKLKYYELIIILLLFSVSIRALYGLTAVFAWKKNIYLLFTLTFAIVAGKSLGGFFAEKFGWLKTSVFVLLISAPLLSFFQNSPLLTIIGAFLFQMTMPITLTALSNILPGKSATAFGLTALALVIGAIPTYIGAKPFFESSWIKLTIIFISAASLFISFKFLYNYFKNQTKINL